MSDKKYHSLSERRRIESLEKEDKLDDDFIEKIRSIGFVGQNLPKKNVPTERQRKIGEIREKARRLKEKL